LESQPKVFNNLIILELEPFALPILKIGKNRQGTTPIKIGIEHDPKQERHFRATEIR
jgi:hypothetical protein